MYLKCHLKAPILLVEGDPGAAESWWLSLSLARAVQAAGVILCSAGSSTMGRNGGGQAQQVLHGMVAAGSNNSAVYGWSHRWGSRSMAQPGQVGLQWVPSVVRLGP